MMRSAHLLLVTAGAGLIAGCTASPAGAPGTATGQQSARQCFTANQVNNFSPNTAGFVDVRVGANRYFRLELGGGCPNINWAAQVGIRSSSGGSFICEGYEAELIVPDPSITQRCSITRIMPITREQFQAGQRR